VRGQTKVHQPLVRGRVVRLFEEGHGFIEDGDGNEYYFDRASVEHPNFDKLQAGDSVEFLAELASQGRQAKRVTVSGPASGQEMPPVDASVAE